jgi:hypothetical protein
MLDMDWYTIPERLSVPEFHTGTYQYIGLQYPFSPFHFCDDISLFAFKKYIGTSKFSFRALIKMHISLSV